MFNQGLLLICNLSLFDLFHSCFLCPFHSHLKKKKNSDEDMMSTFSRVSRSSMKDVADDDEDEEEDTQVKQTAKGRKKKGDKAAKETLA